MTAIPQLVVTPGKPLPPADHSAEGCYYLKDAQDLIAGKAKAQSDQAARAKKY